MTPPAWNTPDYISVVVSIAAFLVSSLSALYARRQSVAANESTAIQRTQHEQREAERSQARVEACFTRHEKRLQLRLANVGSAPATGLRLFVDGTPAEECQFIWPDDQKLFPIGTLPAGAASNIGLFVPEMLPPSLHLRLTWSDPSSSNREW
jgi:hypothetical protein